MTRDEIQSYLWPDGEHLDHEHAINRAMNNLRSILRDKSQKPRYIGTVPKRGYYFVASTTQDSVQNLEQPNSLAEAAGSIQFPLITPKPRPEPEQVVQLNEDAAVLSVSAPLLPYSGTGQTPPTSKRTISFRTLALLAGLLTLFALVAALWLYREHRSKPQGRVLVLGVAPFKTADPESELLAESFRSDMMDSLAQLPSVELRASHSLDTLQRDDAGIRESAGRLNLDVLLLGSVRIKDGLCFIDFELVRGADAMHLASFRYSGSREELSTIRDKVQRDIFRSLQEAGHAAQAIRGSTQNPKAYEAYLRARELAHQRTRDSLLSSLVYYHEALRRDSSFARAYAGIATVDLASHVYTNDPSDMQAARDAANQALTLVPDLAEAHAVLGMVAFRQDRDFTRSETELRMALSVEPHQAMYHAWLAEVLVLETKFDEALHQMDLAHSDDPLWAQLYNIEISVAGATRNYDRAISAAEHYIAMSPESSNARDELAWSYFGEKRFPDAIAQWRQMAIMERDPIRIALEDRGLQVFQKEGITGYGRLRLQTIKNSASGQDTNHLALQASIDRHPNDFISAEWHAYLGDIRTAVREIKVIIATNNSDPVDLAIDAMYDNLHADPEFLATLAHMGLRLPSPTIARASAP